MASGKRQEGPCVVLQLFSFRGPNSKGGVTVLEPWEKEGREGREGGVGEVMLKLPVTGTVNKKFLQPQLIS